MTKRTLQPQHLSKTDWYYEYPTYLLLVHEVRDNSGRYIQTDQIKLHWRKIGKSMRRSYRPRARIRNGRKGQGRANAASEHRH